jgi:uncharacterized membrane protein
MKNKRFFKIAGGAALFLLLLALTGCGTNGTRTTEATQAATVQAAQAATAQATEQATTAQAASSDLVIPIAEIAEDAGFYAINVDGTQMEVIAVRAPDGTIRTAFNTCQVCYDSGRGYYVQDGDKLVCQNCGNRFSMAQVEVDSGGCNPWPIFDGDKQTDAENITIPYAFLKNSAALFENWKSVQY